jgi:uncharacterized protein (TIGR02466 family)
MNAPVPPQADLQVASLFATPVALVEAPGAAALCAELKRTILARSQTSPGTQHSNLGGWQSSWDMESWGGPAGKRILELARATANRMTIDRASGRPATPVWRANMWANVNRSGHGNEFHSHPGSYWSAVFYVEDGGIGADANLGGELEFMDPRGPAPAMYAPQLAFATPGGQSAGANESIRPRSGLMVMFPAWLLHAVRPYRGAGVRISIALNLSL